ncbi:MAG: hypothetical protein WBO09_01720 [Methylocystis silviterrae]|uniref:hypothetical protein n=1 Tax=Methylocystis silviterrae TaxID=2743612 RepID=UPI003C7092D0
MPSNVVNMAKRTAGQSTEPCREPPSSTAVSREEESLSPARTSQMDGRIGSCKTANLFDATDKPRRDILFNCCPNHAPPDWSRFAALEIGGCAYRADEDSDESWIEGGLSDDAAEFWTIYGRLKDGLAEAITDCASRGLARDVAATLAALSGLPIASPPPANAPAATPKLPAPRKTLDERELATVLAALRRWQRALANEPMPPEWDIANNAGTVEPMSEEEIDKLCERLNFHDNRL